MDGALGALGLIGLMSSARLSRLVGMSDCLEESKNYSEVSPSVRLVKEFDSRACHLFAMSVTRGPGWINFCETLKVFGRFDLL
jgi:hypothetical protein